MKPTQYNPQLPIEFYGKTNRIANLVFSNIGGLLPDESVKWLFYGHQGTGKSRLALVCANKLAGHSSYVYHINGQSMSVEAVRSWRDINRYKPLPGFRPVVLVDEVDMASHAAFSEVRTFLDELNNGMCFIATTNKRPDELEPQFQSRLKPYKFEAIPNEEIVSLLQTECDVPSDVAWDVVKNCGGCVRQALIDAESVMELRQLQG